nr:hypothetical protein [Kibdelosporangium sp. MJ126-NF4]CEL21527.1 hypothetical protein [Kibdelosporangium sp. MJ126-NF4]CTQ95906.1 hypothetical protein [Kibdelosporangium sp. MJ126-NF4]
MSGPVEIVLIVAAVGYVLTRRMLGEPIVAKRMLLLPVVLIGFGLIDLVKGPQSAISIGFLAATTALSVVLGLLRGASTRVFEKDGVAYLRYTVMTLVLWGVNIAVKVGAGVVLGSIDPGAAQASSTGLMFTLGAGLLAEGAAVLAKAVRTEGRIMWAKGRDGQPHRMSPTLDQLQQRARATDASRVDG